MYALTVPKLADQLVPELLVKQFNTLPKQCRHIEHMHKWVSFSMILFLQYLQESLIEFPQTLQTHLYLKDKYFDKHVKARGKLFKRYFPL